MFLASLECRGLIDLASFESLDLCEIEEFIDPTTIVVGFEDGFRISFTVHAHPLWTSLQPLLEGPKPRPWKVSVTDDGLQLVITGNDAMISKTLRESGVLPREYELVRVFRLMSTLGRIGNMQKSDLQRHVPSFSRTSPVRLPVSSVGYWGGMDFIFGGESTPLSTPNVSLCIVPCNQLPSKDIMMEIKALTPKEKVHDGYLQIDSVLWIHDQAKRRDYRVFTPANLQLHAICEIHPLDYKEWNLIDVELEPSECRYRVHWAKTNPKIRVPAYAIHWRACISKLSLPVQGVIPHADWNILYTDDEEDYAYKHISTEKCYAACKRYGITEPIHFIQDIQRNSFITPFPKTQMFTNFFTFSEKESIDYVCVNVKDETMLSFGLLHCNNAWSTKAFNRIRLKTKNVLSFDSVEQCFDGYSLQNAKLLMQDERPSCQICTISKIGAMFDSCGHTLCEKCIQTVCANDQPVCPFCRTTVTEKEYTILRKKLRSTAKTLEKLSRQKAAEKVFSNLQNVCILATAETEDVIRGWFPSAHIYTLSKDPLCMQKFNNLLILEELHERDHYLQVHKMFQTFAGCTLHWLSDSEFTHRKQDEFSKCYSYCTHSSVYIDDSKVEDK